MQPGLYQFCPRDGGKPIHAIVKFYAKGRLKMRLVDVDSPGRRPSPLIPVATALWFGRLVPLVPADESSNGHIVRIKPEDWHGEVNGHFHQPFYEALDQQSGYGTWRSHSDI